MYSKMSRRVRFAPPNEDSNKLYKYNKTIERYLLSVANGMSIDQAKAKAKDELIEDGNENRLKDFERDVSKKSYNNQIITQPWQTQGVPEDDVIAMLERYSTLNIGGQQWAVPPEVYKNLSTEGKIFEMFASPFNRSESSTKWCSLFKEDAIFGSLGPYQDVLIPEFKDMLVVINPPFIEYIIEDLIRRIGEINKVAKGLVFILPNWTDTKWYAYLNKHFYKIDKKGSEYHFYNYSTDKEVLARFATVVFTNYQPAVSVMEKWE